MFLTYFSDEFVYISCVDEGHESKFLVGEISAVKYEGVKEILSKKWNIVKVENSTGKTCRLPIEKFIPERCSPAFEFKKENIESYKDDKDSNSQLWSKIVFWLADGNRCAIDLHNMANATIKIAKEALYSKEIVDSLDLLKDEKHRLQTFESSTCLGDYWSKGDLWWAPPAYVENVSKDGRDLNLEVINQMMVSYKRMTIKEI